MTYYFGEHELDRRLRVLGPNATPAERLSTVWSFYEEKVGASLSRPPTAAERSDVVTWLRQQRAARDMVTLMVKQPSLRGAAHQTLVEKASSLAKMFCQSCDTVTRSDGSIPLSINFPIEVDPWSAQSEPAKVKIRETVSAQMKRKRIVGPTTLPVCITIVSLLPASSRVVRGFPVKDSDNLVKGPIDSFQGFLYENNRQIQCLTARRVVYSGPTGAYFVHARAVEPWGSDVILDDGKPPIIL